MVRWKMRKSNAFSASASNNSGTLSHHLCTRRLGRGKLAEELERLKTLTGLGHDLNVRWLPKANGKLSGDVKERVIYVYDEDEATALQTLKHEFLDVSLSQIIELYKAVTNRLIALINDEAYQRKERLIEALAKLL